MTAPQLSVSDFLSQGNDCLIIDVRSPVEFKKGHMVNAVNIPLFEDAERAEIGTLYKKQGKETAVTRGLEIVSPKMVSFVTQAKAMSKNNKAFVYCFRGGMRSNSFAWLLNTSGMETAVMKGGYKAYRNFVLASFKQKRNLVLLGGKTGSGKTDVLKHLAQKHIQVVDLEGIAHHKGSAFGSINEGMQNPQQIFENELYRAFSMLDIQQPVFIENESQNIGHNRIPHELWLQMKQAVIIKLEIPFDIRVQKLVKDYTTVDVNLLKNAVKKITQQLGPQHTKACLQLLDEGKLADVAALTLRYYDKTYEYSASKYKQHTTIIESDTIDAEVNAEKVMDAYNSLKINNAV